MPNIEIGPLNCAAGTKSHGIVPAVNRVDGTTLGIPVMILAGANEGPTLLVDGGIHGDEQEGTIAIAALMRELDPNNLNGNIIGVPVMNVGAFEAMARGNPRDSHTYDMNRIYPGNPSGYLTDRIAHAHNEVIGKLADLEITIHSGGNICYLGETIFTKSKDERSLRLAQAMGEDWPIILDTPHPVGSPMAEMVERGKIAITIELGGAATTMPHRMAENVAVLKKAMVNVARHYRMLEGEPTYAKEVWRGAQSVVRASKSGVLIPNPELGLSKLKQPIRKGETLLQIADLFGEPIEDLDAPCDGTLFGFRTYPSTTAGDWTLFCGDASWERMPVPDPDEDRF